MFIKLRYLNYELLVLGALLDLTVIQFSCYRFGLSGYVHTGSVGKKLYPKINVLVI